jgi:hypothetical protein
MSRHYVRMLAMLLPSIVLLVAVASAAGPSLWVTPLELDFGPVGVGVAAPTQIVTITNVGATPITQWAGGAPPAPFNATQDCNRAGGLLPLDHCSYYFDFTPTAPGVFNGTSTSSTSGGTFTILVHGQGLPAAVIADPFSLDFGSLRVGFSATQVVSIRNTGPVTITQFAGGAVSAPFNATQDCVKPGGLPPGQACHYFITFSPTSAGAFSATSNSVIQGVPITIGMKGSGRTLLLANGSYGSPLGLDFGPVGVGAISSQLQVTLTNQSSVTGLSGISGGTAAPPFFLASTDCGSVLGPLSVCHYNYAFQPSAPGLATATAQVDYTQNFSNFSFSVALRGTGVGAGVTATPLSLDFGPQLLRVPSQQVVTIRNTGLAPLTGWAGGAVSAPFNATQDCNRQGGLQPGDTCHYFFTFTPTAVGSYTAISQSATNGGNIRIAVQGSGVPTRSVFLPAVGRASAN